MNWINVKDKLPEYGQTQYLCYGYHTWAEPKVRCFYAAKYLDKFSGWTITGIGGLEVTHWMELPDAPESAVTSTNKQSVFAPNILTDIVKEVLVIQSKLVGYTDIGEIKEAFDTIEIVVSKLHNL